MRKVSLGFNKAGLEVDDVVAELVVFGLDNFVVLIQDGVIADLFFELLDVSFFTLSEGSLQDREEGSATMTRYRRAFSMVEAMVTVCRNNWVL